MARPTVLITGCSSGIGLAAAVEFAGHGWDVVATMRDVGRSDALRAALAGAGVEAAIEMLDVADDGSVAEAVPRIAAAHGGVDVIVSNAGIGLDGTTEELFVDDFRRSLETNALGSVRLLQAVLPAWRARGSGRFVAVGSTAGALGMPFNDAYCMSKFALEGLLESLGPVVAAFGVRLAILEAGPVAGDFAHKYGAPAGRVDGPYAAARARFQAVQDGGYTTAQTSAEIAEVLFRLATMEQPPLRMQSSDSVAKLVGLKLADLSGARVTGLTRGWI